MSLQLAEPGITRIVPWKQVRFTGACGTHEVPAEGTMTSKVTWTCAPASHPEVTVPLSTAFRVGLFSVPSISATNECAGSVA